jgi:hypothetical protein
MQRTPAEEGRETCDLARRRGPHLEVMDGVPGNVVPFASPPTLLSLNQRGLVMESEADFVVGAVHEFRYTVADAVPILFGARVLRSLKVTADREVEYVVVLEFLGDVAQDPEIRRLMQLESSHHWPNSGPVIGGWNEAVAAISRVVSEVSHGRRCA